MQVIDADPTAENGWHIWRRKYRLKSLLGWRIFYKFLLVCCGRRPNYPKSFCISGNFEKEKSGFGVRVPKILFVAAWINKNHPIKSAHGDRPAPPVVLDGFWHTWKTPDVIAESSRSKRFNSHGISNTWSVPLLGKKWCSNFQLRVTSLTKTERMKKSTHNWAKKFQSKSKLHNTTAFFFCLFLQILTVHIVEDSFASAVVSTLCAPFTVPSQKLSAFFTTFWLFEKKKTFFWTTVNPCKSHGFGFLVFLVALVSKNILGGPPPRLSRRFGSAPK